MLNLTLNVGDYIVIGDDIRIHYSRNNGNATYRIGVEAPKSIKITRSKIYEENLLKTLEGAALQPTRKGTMSP